MDRVFLAASGIAGFLGVAAGAFGAHALKERLDEKMMAAFHTGVLYQLVHAVALGFVALAASRWPTTTVNVAGWLFIAGIVLFSGSLYVLALSGVRGFGAITPIGGLCFLGGWACLVIVALKAPAS